MRTDAPPHKASLLTFSWESTLQQRFVRYLLFSALMALVFTVVGFLAFASGDGAWRNLAGWRDYYVANLSVALCIGACISGLYHLGYRLLGRARIRGFVHWQRALFFCGLAMVGVTIGSYLSQQLLGTGPISYSVDSNKGFGLLLFTLLLSGAIYQFYAVSFRRIEAERRATDAQLRLLQGQMEPHFLFNTLANVLGLMEVDTPRARVMLEAFVDYLRSSLGSLRRGDNTLGDELALVEAYLRIIAIRMDTRLRYRIDVAEALRRLPLPPLTLQPLVENAIVHGLEPCIDGGTVTVAARLDAGTLVLTVVDDGMGLPDGSLPAGPRRSGSSGTALANLRERLRHAHGAAASLDLAAATPRGVRASLRIPAAAAVGAAIDGHGEVQGQAPSHIPVTTAITGDRAAPRSDRRTGGAMSSATAPWRDAQP